MNRSFAMAASAIARSSSRPRLAGLLASPGRRALLDDLGQLALFLSGEEGDEPDFVEVLTY